MAEWLVYAVAAMLAFSVANFALKELMKNDLGRLVDANRPALLAFAISLAAFLFAAWLVFLRGASIPTGVTGLAAAVIVLSLAGFACLLMALNSGKVSLVTAVLNASTIAVALLALAFGGESLSLKEAAGIAIATIGLFVIVA
ncbi:MAG: EamA family transporter [Candidatus Micrarchaeota archaeon]